MKARTFRATLERLQSIPSYSRARVIYYDAFPEAMIRTRKYRPTYPVYGFADPAAAQAWSDHSVNWYKHEHRHSGLRYVAPDQRHRAKHGTPATFYVRRPERCSSNTRDWLTIGAVTLNPDNEEAAPSSNRDKNPFQAV